MKNKGLHQHRFIQNPLERKFALAWDKINNTKYCGNDTIEYLLFPTPNDPRPVSKKDREIAATVIQWLGSPCGQGFLRDIS